MDPIAPRESSELTRLLEQVLALSKPGVRVLVQEIVDAFLSHSKKHHKGYENYRFFLSDFAQALGSSSAADIRPFDVITWLDSHKTWGGGRRNAIIAVKAAFSWADEQGLCPHPVRKLKAGRVKKRKRVLAHAELTEILGVIGDQSFRDFMQALLETGCRPSEVARVSAADCNFELGMWVFDEHKTEDKVEKPRVVYLTPMVLELSRTLAEKYPTGPLFRGRRGKGFSPNAIRCRFRRLRAKLPHLKHFVCYNVRHTYATNALMNGLGVADVAVLLGHNSPEMVLTTYGHLGDQTKHMRDLAKKAIGSTNGGVA